MKNDKKNSNENKDVTVSLFCGKIIHMKCSQRRKKRDKEWKTDEEQEKIK